MLNVRNHAGFMENLKNSSLLEALTGDESDRVLHAWLERPSISGGK
jgi:hypothetical protein